MVGGEYDGKNMMVPYNSGSEQESKGKKKTKKYELMWRMLGDPLKLDKTMSERQ